MVVHVCSLGEFFATQHKTKNFIVAPETGGTNDNVRGLAICVGVLLLPHMHTGYGASHSHFVQIGYRMCQSRGVFVCARDFPSAAESDHNATRRRLVTATVSYGRRAQLIVLDPISSVRTILHLVSSSRMRMGPLACPLESDVV